MENPTTSPAKRTGSDFEIDLRSLGQKLLRYWWLFVVGLVISVSIGQLYLRYTTPLYMTRAKLMIKEVGLSGNLSETAILAESFGLGEAGKDMDNEIQILLSRPILAKTVERIGANISYLRYGQLKSTELYQQSPIEVTKYRFAEDVEWVSFYILLGYEGDFELRSDPETEGKKYKLGDTFINSFGEFTIDKSTAKERNPGLYLVYIMPPEAVAAGYKSRLQVEVVGAQHSSSILELKLTDKTPQKAEDFLNALIEVYNEADRNDKTQVLRNTIEFIEDRIDRLNDELTQVEGDIERFKRENEIINENASSSLNFALVELRSALATLSNYEVQRELLRSVEEYVSESDHSLIPTNVTTADPSLGALISEYNDAFLDQQKLRQSVTDENQLIGEAEARLDELKDLILVSIRNHREDLAIPMAKTQREIDLLKGNLNAIPTVEQELIEKIRMQGIKESLYLFLLQKKEETELSEAISSANTRIIEPAMSSSAPVFPARKLILLASVLLGLLVPAILIGLLMLLETTVNSEEILKGLTTVPIIGRIPHRKGKGNFVIQQGERSAVSEMFRFLRTNLNYVNLDAEKQVILITSSVKGEGKSAISINLGLTIALSRKKVVLVGMDLRMPKLHEYLEVPDQPGVTNYLTGQCKLEEIVHAYQGSEHFHYIPSGPIPPDPAELIMSDQMAELIDRLREEYDYVLLDSPPVVVADALLLRKFTTSTLYVVRQGHTRKSSLRSLEERFHKGELIKPSIVLNDIRTVRRFSSPYYGAGNYINTR